MPHPLSVLLLLALAGCEPTKTDDTGGDRFHPAGWSASDQHGQAAKYQELACTSCHGADLDGGTAERGCDTCHAEGWRTDCTFCHGGTDDTSGAPPRDIDGLETDLAFPEHTAHVAGGEHPAWTCDQCHTTPTDVLSAGHLFVDDGSPGLAEVSFANGLSADGVFGSTCSNLYCHGDGVASGSIASGEALDCGGCHGTADTPGTLSGGHPAHLAATITCGECHASTATGNDVIADATQHVDGEIDVALTYGMVLDGGTCTGTCHDVVHNGRGWTDASAHPSGWDAPEEHGSAAKLQEQDCTECHGVDLAGGTSGQGCDDCHSEGWRTDCTYCHGGVDNTTGAPPDDIGGAELAFLEHTAHVEELDHPAWGCAQCHTTPTDALSVGHLFIGDTTPAAAEVAFTTGLSPAGTYTSTGCSNLYCHGDGGTNLGTVASGETLDCEGCHGGAVDPGTLSEVHAAHLDEGATCAECHSATALGNDTIADATQHVDGGIDVGMPSGMVESGGACTGTCHGVDHDGSTWVDGGFHPVGWDAADVHGPVANLQEQDCTTCHGADLTGGTSGESCDSCHTAGWRTNCTYCHGGTDNTTGAPPEDMDGSTTLLSFDEHTTHVEEGDHAAWGCEQCHTDPVDVLTAGHVYVGDTTPAVAEVDFVSGLSADGSYASTGTCSNLYCHGDGDGTLGTVTTGATTTCGSCHGSASGSSSWNQLSGEHAKHMRDASAECGDCHATTVSGDSTILDPALHVNAATDTSFPSGIVWDGTRCSGSCHSRDHGSEDRW